MTLLTLYIAVTFAWDSRYLHVQVCLGKVELIFDVWCLQP